jgi:hypothetical protein
MAIQREQTDHGNGFGTDFTWHLRDLGIAHRRPHLALAGKTPRRAIL